MPRRTTEQIVVDTIAATLPQMLLSAMSQIQGQGVAAVAAPPAQAPALAVGDPISMTRKPHKRFYEFNRGKEKKPGYIPASLVRDAETKGRASTLKGKISLVHRGNGLFEATGFWGTVLVAKTN